MYQILDSSHGIYEGATRVSITDAGTSDAAGAEVAVQNTAGAVDVDALPVLDHNEEHVVEAGVVVLYVTWFYKNITYVKQCESVQLKV